MGNLVYKNKKTKEISFPLGGIGTGCIGLGGDGRLVDWEIFNRPNKHSINGCSHFAIKAEKSDKKEVIDVRVINGDFIRDYSGYGQSDGINRGFGSGPFSETMAGVPHFKDTEFIGEYPIAEMIFKDENFPGEVNLTAFNPFIPLNDRDSSIPGAFFNIEATNITGEEITYTVCLTVANPFPSSSSTNKYYHADGLHFIKMDSDLYPPEHPEFGDITIATSGSDISYQEYWYKGSWFDSLGVFWSDFSAYGSLKNRIYTQKGNPYSFFETKDTASIAVCFKAAPFERKSAEFNISWNFPNTYAYWKHNNYDPKEVKTWKNYYASLFKDSMESARYSLENWERLYSDTLRFKKALFLSAMPLAALDAVSANISILKSPTVLRLEDGSFYGWEGCSSNKGSCEGSCSHVWTYAYALPFLFPKLERSMRDLDYRYNQFDDGFMTFRLQLPLGEKPPRGMACVDGQMGGVIKSYRDWKISGDTNWLKSNWPAIKKSLEFAWSETNEFKWDPDKDGVIDGRQHHTLDMELFGPNSWLNGLYLTALKAASEMAGHLGEAEKSLEYWDVFEKGKMWTNENLFNGEYFIQKIDLNDKTVLDDFFCETNTNIRRFPWSNEHNEMKYQIGEGSSIDQVLAQWHANLCGLGEVFNKEKTRSALRSIYKYNFKKEGMRNHFNPCRIYCLNDEKGVVICEWPDGKHKPVLPITYSEECMNGFEYQVASHMIQEGFIAEGIEIIEAVRDRYDGEKRNPWNEFECGSNYARSMASYAILNAFSGFSFNMVNAAIGFDPVDKNAIEQCFFWSLDCGWGLFQKSQGHAELSVLYGEINLKSLDLPFLRGKAIISIICDEDGIDYINDMGKIFFKNTIRIGENKGLTITFV